MQGSLQGCRGLATCSTCRRKDAEDDAPTQGRAVEEPISLVAS